MTPRIDPYRVAGLFVSGLVTLAAWTAILAPLIWSH